MVPAKGLLNPTPEMNFGPYKTTKVLGSGGSGVVYEAVHPERQGRFVIKHFHDHLAKGEGFRKKCAKALEMMSWLGGEHKNFLVVDGFDCESDGPCWFAMPLVEGIPAVIGEGGTDEQGAPERWVTLADRMRSKCVLPVTEVTSILDEIVSALRHAHRKGIVHGNLKPSNILLTNDGVRIADCGLMVLAGDRVCREGVDNASTLEVSEMYSAPEVKVGAGHSFSSDIYSLGRITFEMLTGERDPAGKQVADFRKELSIEWGIWLSCALSPNPKERSYPMLTHPAESSSGEVVGVSEPAVTPMEPPNRAGTGFTGRVFAGSLRAAGLLGTCAAILVALLFLVIESKKQAARALAHDREVGELNLELTRKTWGSATQGLRNASGDVERRAALADMAEAIRWNERLPEQTRLDGLRDSAYLNLLQYSEFNALPENLESFGENTNPRIIAFRNRDLFLTHTTKEVAAWTVTGFKKTLVFDSAERYLDFVTLSPDEKFLVVASGDRLHFFNTASWESTASVALPRQVTKEELRFTGFVGTVGFYVVLDATLFSWSLADGSESGAPVKLAAPPLQLVLRPDGSRGAMVMIAVDRGGLTPGKQKFETVFFNTKTGATLWNLHNTGDGNICFSPDSKWLLKGFPDKVIAYEAEDDTAKLRRVEMETHGDASGLYFSQDQSRLCVETRLGCRIFRFPDGNLASEENGYKFYRTTGYGGGFILVDEDEDSNELRLLTVDPELLDSSPLTIVGKVMDISEDGRLLTTYSSGDNRIHFYDIVAGRKVGHPITPGSAPSTSRFGYLGGHLLVSVADQVRSYRVSESGGGTLEYISEQKSSIEAGSGGEFYVGSYGLKDWRGCVSVIRPSGMSDQGGGQPWNRKMHDRAVVDDGSPNWHAVAMEEFFRGTSGRYLFVSDFHHRSASHHREIVSSNSYIFDTVGLKMIEEFADSSNLVRSSLSEGAGDDVVAISWEEEEARKTILLDTSDLTRLALEDNISVVSLARSHRSDLIAVGLSDRLLIYKGLQSGQAILDIKCTPDEYGEIDQIAFSPSDELIAVGVQSGSGSTKVQVWRLLDGAKVLEGDGVNIAPASEQVISPLNRQPFCWTKDGLFVRQVGKSLVLLNPAIPNSPRDEIPVAGEISSFRHDATLGCLVVASDKEVTLWRDSSREEPLARFGHSELVGEWKLSPDSSQLLTSTADGVTIWDIETKAEVIHLPFLKPGSITISGKWLAVTSEMSENSRSRGCARLSFFETCAPDAGEVPAELFDVISGLRPDERGGMTELPMEERIRLRHTLLDHADRRIADLAKWVFGQGQPRSATPDTAITDEESLFHSIEGVFNEIDSSAHDLASLEGVSRVYSKDPANPFVHLALATSLHRSYDDDEAKQQARFYVETSLRRIPADSKKWGKVSSWLYRIAFRKEAAEAMRRALELNGDDPDALWVQTKLREDEVSAVDSLDYELEGGILPIEGAELLNGLYGRPVHWEMQRDCLDVRDRIVGFLSWTGDVKVEREAVSMEIRNLFERCQGETLGWVPFLKYLEKVWSLVASLHDAGSEASTARMSLNREYWELVSDRQFRGWKSDPFWAGIRSHLESTMPGLVEIGDNFDSALETEYVWIKPGPFAMGSEDGERAALLTPQAGGKKEHFSDEFKRDVSIQPGYWIAAYETTIREYVRFLNESRRWDDTWVNMEKDFCPIRRGEDGIFRMRNATGATWGDENLPMVAVSWSGARAYCEWLTSLDATRLPIGYRYDLPSEAQWEKACRAGTDTMTYVGNLTFAGSSHSPELDSIAWYSGNSGLDHRNGFDSSGWLEKQYDHTSAGTHQVGMKSPNLLQLHDMIGNVQEWCLDWYGLYPNANGEVTDNPAGPESGDTRVCRGGAWNSVAVVCRAAFRSRYDPEMGANNIGFRPVLARSGE
jgi:formylglycine-generating enzyme required for sulfatase activity/serine/threonine protein kinase/WD40 repeat protein